ncbi:chromate efflux transporter [Ruegeria sp. R13_0]|uniref:chromate efflux transporter n=1 Tax=Ruegeria sp. R13_0 TaxID=2821099 RepID=UPI001ADBF50A|nr:chromate efflux transporter [Ruegeria sp. R13_0]MBO9435137.1 chromate efflux transporter [Ruegeria sp. R13_0]
MTPSMHELVLVFGRIGLLSFGGPAAQISLMHQELVDRRAWLSEETYLRALSLCMLLPGPEAMQLATYAGWRLRGVTGGLIAGTLFVLPGAMVIAALVLLYARFGTLPLVQAGFLGIKATVIVIVLQALLKLSRKALTDTEHRLIAGIGFLGIFLFNLPFPLIILAAALWGYASFKGPVAQQDTSPRASFSGTLRTVAIWVPLWLGPLVLLSLSGHQLLSDLGWFFARLAVVTFGGAYAVLAYMTQTVVDQYQWISTGQMIDALGLAETTPGPLILVTQFVAMLTGQINGGVSLAFAAGAVALWATFVPCFLWIFLAAPYLDKLATRPRLSAGLHGITAAVVGVILNLSVWFALNVLFGALTQYSWGPVSIPLPGWDSLNLTAVALTIAAGVLIFRAKLGMATVLALMSVTGIAIQLL